MFQAEATLQSIIDNYEPNDALKQEARDKLTKLKSGKGGKLQTPDGKKNNGYLEMDETK